MDSYFGISQESALFSTQWNTNYSIFTIDVKGAIPRPKDFLNLEVVRIQIHMESDILCKVMYQKVQEPTHCLLTNIHPRITPWDIFCMALFANW